MRIAMIGAKGIPVEAGLSGGVERVVEELAPRLVEHGHVVTVYVRAYANPSGRKRWNGVRLITVPCVRLRYLETISHVFLSTLRAMWEGYDILHYHGVGPSTLAWIPRVFAPKIRVVVTFHSRDRMHEMQSRVARAYLALGEWTAVYFPHATIAVSHVIQKFCREELKKNVFFIPNGVQPPDISHVPTDRLAAMGLKPGKYFLGLGRLVRFKAFDIAIDAYRKVKTDMPYAIAGATGYDVRYAERLLRAAGRDERVRLLGFRADEDLRQLLAHAYAVIHPSRAEGMSLSVLEAMSYGKLVIMSDIPENREIADHSAVCLPVDDRESFTKGIQRAIRDPEWVKMRGQRARVFITEHYALDPMVRETERVYRHVLADAPVADLGHLFLLQWPEKRPK